MSEFDEFLFTPLGDGANGAPLSMLTVLARLNVDPWEEAARLAHLPLDTATRKVTSLIAALPEQSLARADPAAMAHRLVALLRPPPPAQQVPSQPAPSAWVALRPRLVTFAAWYLVAITMTMLGHWILASHHAQVQTDLSPVSTTVSPEPVLPPSAE